MSFDPSAFEARLLVTGGAGFIGSALVRRLVRETAALVVNVDKLTYAGNLDSLVEVAEELARRRSPDVRRATRADAAVPLPRDVSLDVTRWERLEAAIADG